MEESVSPREQKKQATKQRIVAAAHTLFELNGYAETTLADIAAKAEVSPRTIFSYFPSKESIVFELDRLIIDRLAARLKQRGSETVFDVLRQFITDITESQPYNCQGASMSEHKQLIRSEPELQEYALHCRNQIEQILLEAFAEELGDAPQDLRPRMVAAVARAVIDYIDELDSADCPMNGDPSLLEDSLRFVEAGLRAMQHD